MLSESDYNLFGCFIDNSNNIFPNNMTNITGKNFSIKECAQQAVNNKSMVFGITSDKTNNGICLLSDPNKSGLQQVYDSVKEGLVYDGCPESYGEKDKNSVSVFVNNKALSFFNDVQVQKDIEISTDSFIDELAELNNKFEKITKQFDKAAIEDFKPYANNDIASLFNATNSGEFLVLQQNYKYLFETIQSENDELFSQIESLNKQIQNIDNIRIKANERLEFIVNSDNAALGNVSDISFRANTVILENIGLILVGFILIVLCAMPKSNIQKNLAEGSVNKK